MPNDRGPWCPTRGYLDDSGGKPAPAPEETGAAEAPAPEAAAAPSPAASSGGGGDQYWTPTRGYLGSGGAAAPAPAAEAAAEPVEEVEVPAEAPAEVVTATREAPEKEAVADEPEVPDLPEEDPLRESVTTVDPLVEGAGFNEFTSSIFSEPDSETTLYRVSALNVAFAVSSAALLLITLLVFWQDYDRQWKHIQAHWRDGQIEKAEAELSQAKADQLDNIEKSIKGYEAVIRKLGGSEVATAVPESYEKRVERALQLEGEINTQLQLDPDLAAALKTRSDLSFQADIAGRAEREERGNFQAAKFLFEEEKKHALAGGVTEKAKADVDRLSEEFNKTSVKRLDGLSKDKESADILLAAAEEKYADLLNSKTAIGLDGENTDFPTLQKELKGNVLAVTVARKGYELIDSSMRNAIRNAPLLDFMAPSYTIDKVVTPGLKESLNFLNVERVHRCKTCHLNIDDPDPRFVGLKDEKWGTVYASHPRLDLFLSSASPHNYQDIGCTTCHYGDGHAIEFTIAAHTPSGSEQKKHWEDQYHWHEKHYEEHPMLPAHFTDSSCTKCHNEQWEIEGAETLNLGKKLVRTYGCFGCHTIEGFEVAAGASDDRVWKFNKVGPNLKHLAGKVSMDFLNRWIRKPGHFRQSSRMPQFFDLTNSRGKMVRPLEKGSEDSEEIDFSLRNSVEVLGLSTYLFNSSLGEKLPGAEGSSPAGDPVRGRELVKTLGCMGCHSIKVESEGEYDEALPALSLVVDSLQKKAAEAAGSSGLAAAYGKTAGDLEKLYGWLNGLDVGEDVEGLYSSTRRAIEKARQIEDSLELEESAVESAGLLADAAYNRWVHNTFGPDLSPLARKFDLESKAGRDKAVSWLSGWILNPQQHDPESIMPRFRLTPGQDSNGEQKIADMVSYLLTLDYNDVDLAANPSASPASLGESEKTKRQKAWDDGLVTTNVSEIDNDPEKKKILDEIATFYLRSRHGTSKASDLLKGSKPMSTSEKLELVGHRLVRRYGCFGCHNGIKDIDPDPEAKKERLAAAGSARVAYFDGYQPIGAELNKWGNKGSDRLDFGQWGHQEDGSEAIPHRRYDWATAKLSDTRQFDVLPRRVLDGKSGHGETMYKYLPTSQLAHKGADELLKMPLFPFHDKPEQVEAVVSYVISLVDDPVDPTMKKHLSAREKTLEAGSRLVQKLNCSGCHRIGATTSYVGLDQLPNPNGLGAETGRINAMQAETWLARKYRLAARPVAPVSDKLGIPLPAGFVLGQQVGQYTTGDKKADESLPQVFSPNEDPMSLVDVARRHFNPLPGFVQDLVMAIDSVVNEEEVGDTLANVGIYNLVKKPPLEAAALVETLRKAYEDESSKLGAFLVTMLEAPYDQDLDALGEDLGVGKSDFETLAQQYYKDGVLGQRPLSEQKLAVKGYGEGGVRFYSGTSLTDRFKAPPPLLRQGERVKSDWFFHFLKDVQPIRPWLKIRMPSFNLTQEEARLIVKWFKLVSEVPYGDEIFTEDNLEVDQALKGQLLFGKGTEQEKGKQCSQCHPRGADLPTLPILTQGAGQVEPADVPLSAPGDSHFLVWKDAAGKVLLEGGFGAMADAQAAGGKLGDKAASWAVGKPWDKSSWGPDLGKAAGRLRVQWMRDWLYFPPDFMPGTKMPNYFQERKKYAGKTDSEIDAKELADVNALLQYLRHMNDAKIATSAPAKPDEEAGGGQ
ncbi:MAG: hypothetical protein VYD81_05865 [Planctomycetota bacterium]|nr:hypothetical protein [Planctomycetota bacterium]